MVKLALVITLERINPTKQQAKDCRKIKETIMYLAVRGGAESEKLSEFGGKSSTWFLT